jgi:hypothetical protein
MRYQIQDYTCAAIPSNFILLFRPEQCSQEALQDDYDVPGSEFVEHLSSPRFDVIEGLELHEVE